MAGEKDIKKSEQIAPGQMSDSSIKLPEKDMVKDGRQSDSVSSVSGVKGVIDHLPVSDQGAYYPPTSCYDYYYPVGYNGTFTQSEDKGYFNAAGGPYTFGSGYQSAGMMRGFHPTGKFSMITDQNRRYYLQKGPTNYQSNSRARNNNFRQRPGENFARCGEFENSMELTRGPRGDNRNNPLKLPTEVEMPAPAIERTVYNSKDFQIEYDNAKFYVIKSYSEDDIHKCIKYGVWSSTPNGNKKLDATFHEVDAKAKETGVKCPVFLFFSVNGSGQFVGVAEMIGQVDFSKNMDFWQLDKWNGFFPIKWHVIKDVPNMLLRHIILENNENRAVTYSRDTQEVGLKEGLEILGIFKNYSEKTSVLDDFNFYENREKSLKAKRNAKQVSQSQTNGFNNGDFEKQLEAEGATGEKSVNTKLSDPLSLVSLTKNLSIHSQTANST